MSWIKKAKRKIGKWIKKQPADLVSIARRELEDIVEKELDDFLAKLPALLQPMDGLFTDNDFKEAVANISGALRWRLNQLIDRL